MENERTGNNDKRNEIIFSKKFRAGKRRTYFFDVKATKANDYYLTITESKKRFDGDGYDRHKVFLYKEDFNKFLESLTETINHVKTELMPEYDFDEFSRRDEDYQRGPSENQGGGQTDEPSAGEKKDQGDDDDMKW